MSDGAIVNIVSILCVLAAALLPNIINKLQGIRIKFHWGDVEIFCKERGRSSQKELLEKRPQSQREINQLKQPLPANKRQR